MTAKREFDIVVFGATGFTGVRALEHIKRGAATTLAGLRFAAAGRSRDKVLAALAESQVGALPIIVADSGDAASLDAMCRRASVLVSLVGPYSLYGFPVVEACLRNATHYVDITGEGPFVARVAERHHEEAVAKQVYLLSCCGFDSLPPELTNLVLHRQARARGIPINHVRVAWSISSGSGPSGGTMHSVVNIMKHFDFAKDSKPLSLLGDKVAADVVPFTNPPGGFPAQNFVQSSKDFQAYLAPFIMAGINERVVRKCNALLGINASYIECARTTSLIAAVVMMLVPYMVVLLFLPIIGPLLVKYALPAPGTGPSREAEAKTKLDAYGAGYAAADGSGSPALRVKMEVPRGLGGGYPITGVLCIETAAALVKGELNAEAQRKGTSWSGGGVVTPGAVVGDALVGRLARSANVRFYSTTAATWKSDEMQAVDA
jgi:short subunit dehydrogenase-like uncharacterized protein